jgi:DNA-binding response OmpR family regulator
MTGDRSADDRPTVLVVDDQPNVAEAYALWLSDEYEVLTATGGAEALDVVDDRVDVGLLDRHMPERSGDEVLAAVRDRGLGCRVAMVTAVNPDFDVVDMPFDDYLTKPVGREDLVETVERLLTLSTYDDQVRDHFSLARKKAVLEAEKTDAELADSETYAGLPDRIDRLEAEMDESVGRMDAEGFASAFQRLGDADGEE